MPFGSYTKVTREDSDAIFAYLKTVPPVRRADRPHDLQFPYNNRSLILGWRTLYFSEGEYRPDATKSDEWNRGAYLVGGLGHCAMCHTAINALGGSSESEAFQGGLIPMQNWYAPSLTSNKEAGLGDWSLKDISDLLRTGVSKRGVVYGPMAEVVHNSLQYLTDEDIRAMAVYLKSSCQGAPPEGGVDRHADGRKQSLLTASERQSTMRRCASCHGADGSGKPPHYPPLAGNQSIQMLGRQPDPDGAERRLPPARREIPRPTACRHSLSACPTTRSRPWSPISAPPGAIAEPPFRRDKRTNCAQPLSTESPS